MALKSSTKEANLPSQTPQSRLATFTTSLLPVGGSLHNRPFFTVTEDIKLNSNVGARDAVPIQATLTLSDG
jgi:hypothetical protein